MKNLTRKDSILFDKQGRRVHDLSSGYDNKEAMTKMIVEYTQEYDDYSEGDAPNSIEFTMYPEGYFAIKTEHWSCDTKEDLINLIEDFFSRFTSIACEKEGVDYKIKEEGYEDTTTQEVP